MQKETLAVLGLFSKRQDLDTELLPPPPPFPDIEPTQHKERPTLKKKEKTKIILKHKEGVKDILAQASKRENEEPEDFLNMDIPHESISADELLQDGDEISNAINDAKKQKSQKISFWKRMFTVKTKTPQQKPSMMTPQEATVQNQHIQEKSQSPIDGVMKLVNQARQQLESLDTKGAKETYVEIMKLYRLMTQEEQSEVYEIIQEIYEERKNAEKLPKA